MASTELKQDDICSSLPDELLEVIIKRLSFIDQIRFAAVCTSWRSAKIGALPALSFHPPFLLTCFMSSEFPNYVTSNKLTFIDFSDGKSYEIEATVLQVRWEFNGATYGRELIGVFYGWMIMYSQSKENMHLISLVNPILNTLVDLPLLGHRVFKVALSSSPNSKLCCVAVILQGRKGVAVCRVGDKKWIIINSENKDDWDLTFCGGKLYIYNLEKSILVYNCDTLPTSITKIRTIRPFFLPCMDNRWVEMEENLCQIYFRLAPNNRDIKGLILCMLHKNGKQWNKVHSLGNQTLFMGRIQSEFVSSDKLIGTNYKKNSIYYINENHIAVISMDGDEGQCIQHLPVQRGSFWYMPKM